MEFNQKDKLEKILKTDVNYLVKSGSWVGIGLVASILLAFLSALVFANLLDPQVYGVYKYVISIASVLYIFTLTGMSTAVARAVAKGFEGCLTQAVKTKIKWGMMGGLAAVGVSLYYLLNGDSKLALAFLITAPFIPFIESFLLFNSFLGGKKEFKTQTNYSTVSSLLASVVIILVLLLTRNLFALIAAYFLSYTLLRLFFLLRTIKKFKPNKQIDTATINYGKHLSYMDAISVVAGNIDTFLIFHFIGAVPLAIYSFALVPVVQLKIINKIIKPLALPKFALREKNEIKNTFTRKILTFAALTTIIVAVYIIAAPYVYHWFFPKYLESIPLTKIAAIALIAGSASIIPTSILEAHKKTKELYIIQVVEGVVDIVLLTIMALLWGLIGLAVAKVLIRFVIFGITTFLAKRYLNS